MDLCAVEPVNQPGRISFLVKSSANMSVLIGGAVNSPNWPGVRRVSEFKNLAHQERGSR